MPEYYAATTGISIARATSTPVVDKTPVAAQGNEFEREIRLLQSEAAAFAEIAIKDPAARATYAQKTRAAADELIELVKQRKVTPHQAAQTAHAMRNQLMDLARANLSDFGMAVSRDMKPGGPPFTYFEEKYAKDMFNKPLQALTQPEREAVWLKIIDKAGQSNPKVNLRVKYMGVAGRAFLVLSLGMAVYNVASAEDKTRQVAKEGVSFGAGLAGGVAGGAVVVALVSNPAGWVVLAGVLVVGAAAGVGASEAFDYFWPEEP
ncbi:MAG: hypothetical protein ACREPV_01705 [Lysobacter sp.]